MATDLILMDLDSLGLDSYIRGWDNLVKDKCIQTPELDNHKEKYKKQDWYRLVLERYTRCQVYSKDLYTFRLVCSSLENNRWVCCNLV